MHPHSKLRKKYSLTYQKAEFGPFLSKDPQYTSFTLQLAVEYTLEMSSN